MNNDGLPRQAQDKRKENSTNEGVSHRRRTRSRRGKKEMRGVWVPSESSQRCDSVVIARDRKDTQPDIKRGRVKRTIALNVRLDFLNWIGGIGANRRKFQTGLVVCV